MYFLWAGNDGFYPKNKNEFSNIANKQGLKTVYREEGSNKLLIGGVHPRFMFNFFNGVMFLFMLDRFNSYVDSLYD